MRSPSGRVYQDLGGVAEMVSNPPLRYGDLVIGETLLINRNLNKPAPNL
ncbi:hypothetical protein PL11201_700147 [Planktothrix sp. PCC 11201]|nr:hypothetical protein PL11201_700147 [Planktothrix sp. PCC 11201]